MPVGGETTGPRRDDRRAGEPRIRLRAVDLMPGRAFVAPAVVQGVAVGPEARIRGNGHQLPKRGDRWPRNGWRPARNGPSGWSAPARCPVVVREPCSVAPRPSSRCWGSACSSSAAVRERPNGRRRPVQSAQSPRRQLGRPRQQPRPGRPRGLWRLPIRRSRVPRPPPQRAPQPRARRARRRTPRARARGGPRCTPRPDRPTSTRGGGSDPPRMD